MPCGWERVHVGADLSDHDLSSSRAKSWHLLQPFHGVAKGRQCSLDTCVAGCNTFLQLHDRPQMLSEQEPMMLSDSPGESLDQRRPCAAEALAAKCSEFLRISLAFNHGRQDTPSAGAQNVRNHRAQLDIRSSRTAWMRWVCCTIS